MIDASKRSRYESQTDRPGHSQMRLDRGSHSAGRDRGHGRDHQRQGSAAVAGKDRLRPAGHPNPGRADEHHRGKRERCRRCAGNPPGEQDLRMILLDARKISHFMIFKNANGGFIMSLAETIIKDVQALSESKQVEVLDFVQYLRSREEKQEIKDWADFSLSSAIRGMEDEQAPYSLNDIKESFS